MRTFSGPRVGVFRDIIRMLAAGVIVVGEDHATVPRKGIGVFRFHSEPEGLHVAVNPDRQPVDVLSPSQMISE